MATTSSGTCNFQQVNQSVGCVCVLLCASKLFPWFVKATFMAWACIMHTSSSLGRNLALSMVKVLKKTNKQLDLPIINYTLHCLKIIVSHLKKTNL